MTRALTALGVALLLAAIPAATAAQTSTREVARIDSLYFAANPAAALAIADSSLRRDSTNVAILWRASRAALALGFLAPHQSSENADYRRAEDYARRASRVAPRDATGHAWLAAALGRRALFADLIPTARLGQAAYEAARQALALDSTNAYAHDVLGKVHSEVRNLSPFYRWVAANVLGVTAARRASWADAELHLRRAIVLDPTMIRYRVDLGELYLRTGRRADAERALREAAALPRRHPPDSRFQAEALELLRTAERP